MLNIHKNKHNVLHVKQWSDSMAGTYIPNSRYSYPRVSRATRLSNLDIEFNQLCIIIA